MIIVTGAPDGWGRDLGDGRQARRAPDIGRAIEDARAAGYRVVGYHPGGRRADDAWKHLLAERDSDLVAGEGAKAWLDTSPATRPDFEDLDERVQRHVLLEARKAGTLTIDRRISRVRSAPR